MPGIGALEIPIILLVTLLVLGPRNLPGLGKGVGQALREFRRSTSGVAEELRAGLEAGPEHK